MHDESKLDQTYTYSPNFMGPAAIKWYEDNNIPFTEETVNSSITGNTFNHKNYEQYAGGRIDISCETCKWEEIGAPIMKATDWNKLHDFCDEFSSQTRLNELEFFGEFEKWLGRPIIWGPGEEDWLRGLGNR